MVWVGVYVAVASLVCSIAMAADAFHGFRHKKLWFPCKFFSLNAASLTILAVAMKLAVDLSTNMPRKKDQLAKLSSTALMSTAIGNFMPSLGTMDDTEILMNMTALAILVTTILANVCIQLGTGLINRNLIVEHIAVMFFMFVSLVILSFSALTVSTTKKHLQLKYSDLHKITSTEESVGIGMATTQKLKDYVKKYWMMAETGSPQFVMARSVNCSALGAICSLTTVILLEAELRTYFTDRCFYSTIGVVVGTTGPVFRWFIATIFKCSVKKGKSSKTEWKTEYYWIRMLVGWRERPLALRFRSQNCRKLVHSTKNRILSFCIGVQIVIVTAGKLVLLISSFLLSPLLSCFHCCKVLKQKLLSKSNASSNHTGSELEPGTQLDLSRFVLYLDGEAELPPQIMNNISNATDHLIQIGKKQQPKYLKELLGKSTGFEGVAKFDVDQIPSLNFKEPPNSWTLPLVTLTSIAIALPNIENQKMKQLHRSISEGLLYVSLVEKILDSKADLVNIRKKAERVWEGVDLFRKWLDKDLRNIAVEGKTSKKTLERLVNIAKTIVMEYKAGMNGQENPLNWPMEVIAANSMYRISQTLLLDHEGSEYQMDHETLFEQLSVMVVDILGACLTNLPHVITTECFRSAIEEREKSVKHAARLLGETEEILDILQQRELPSLNPDQAANINEWHASMKKEDPLAFTSSFNNGASSFGSSKSIE
ncbi:uncharacterized protein LOC132305408 [Cornus florida]|uniref:uncharacterized protein LOC132305408 n=1 Tax=Cornus florida TaxID=4283 RepID=UPI0028963985|nr:uncharacterized protein LOC132305408 [Cornus florida]